MIYKRYTSYKMALNLHKEKINNTRNRLIEISSQISIFLDRYDSNQNYSNKDLVDGQGTAVKRKSNKSWQEKTKLEEEYKQLIEQEYILTIQLSKFYSYSLYWYQYQREHNKNYFPKYH